MTLLPATTHIGQAHLTTADLKRSLAFYHEALGFHVISQADGDVTLSADGHTVHLRLSEHPGWQLKPRSTGLYHVAIRLPNRAQLGRVFLRLVQRRYPFGGFSDHAVSEALYLNDPDGNGLELYRDRPREQWVIRDGQVQMTTEPLDVDDLLAEADDAPWRGIDPATDIGHVHLHVSDLGRARVFYGEVLGLAVAADWSGHGALFMSAGGYHHHLGLNIWAGSRRQPPQTLGLESFSLVVPDQMALEAARERIAQAGVEAETSADGALRVTDDDGNRVDLVVG